MSALALVPVLAGPGPGQNLLINEFLAVNDGGLLDEDGDPSDWIEIHNPEILAAPLAGWSLTDDPADARKWTFPDIVLEPGGFLLVFASAKNRAVPGSPLHASFKLSGDGEYLALVRPDGTVSHQFAPAFPRQVAGISYGLPQEGTSLVDTGAPADFQVPTGGGLGTSWTLPDFVPGAGWTRGPLGLGYESGGNGGIPPPLSYWPLDGDTADAAGPNHGSFEGGAAPRFEDGHDGRGGGALSLDGGNDYLDIAAQSALPIFNQPAYTIAMWVKGLPQPDKRVYSEGSVASNNPLFTLGTDVSGATGKVDLFIRSNSGGVIVNHRLSAGIAFDGAWHHIAWVDAGGTAALYIDGALDGQDFRYAKEPLPLGVASMGAVLRSTACCFFAGAIDDAAIWTSVLGAGDIAALAAGERPDGGGLYGLYIRTNVEGAMRGINGSIYARIPFTVADPSPLDSLFLRVRYDDGFVAYLNGQEVARRNAPAAVAWNSTASAERSGVQAIVEESVDLRAFIASLRAGQNTLAIQGLNHGAADASFLIAPRLDAGAIIPPEARYFARPTPGMPNSGGFIDFVADTKFSVDRGYFGAPFLVALSSDTPGAVIRYTLDGSAPAEAAGLIYSSPIRIDRTTTLRAAAFKDGFQPTNVDTQTYLFLEDVIRQPSAIPGYPAVWQPGFAADYEMDPEICLNPASPVFTPTVMQDLLAIPTLALSLSPDDFLGPVRGIYNHSESRGVAWERAASAELILPGGEEGFQIDCGLRMQGGASRDPVRQLKHSFRLLFKDEYGPKRLEYRLFNDSRVDSFNTLTLRAFFTDGWATRYQEPRYRPDDSQYIRDVWMKDSQLDMGQPSGHNTYVHLYVNGIYWGLYNITERPDADFQASHFGGEEEEWDVFKDAVEVADGNRQAWDQLMGAAAAGLASDAAYHRIQGQNPDGSLNPAYPVLLDADNLIDYMILHIFAGAEDWPHHNWYAARRRGDESRGWRFFSWDQEIALDELTRNRTGVSDPNSPAYVYSSLRQNAEFRLRFGDRVHKHLFNDGALTTAANRARWMRRAGQIDRAVVPESARWGDRRREPPFTRDVEWIREQRVVIDEYLPQIHPLTMDRFRTAGLYPSIEAPEFSQHGGKVARGARVEISAPTGSILYTLDGSDPRLEGGAVAPAARGLESTGETTLLPAGAAARFLVPTGPALGETWTQPDFGDQGWTPATTGLGYDHTGDYTGEIATDVDAALYGINGSIFIRVSFESTDPGGYTSLKLRMKYDDGFVAYLNGRRVADRNAPAIPAWNSLATAGRVDAQAVIFEDIDISAHLDALRAGKNVLAIHGLNASTTSTDFLILPEVAAGMGSAPAIEIQETGVVRARALAAGQWSALTEATFIVDGPLPLRVTEIFYHPAALLLDPPIDPEDLEFIEIANIGEERAWLLGVRFAAGIAFDFTGGAIRYLEPGEAAVVVRNLKAFESVNGPGIPITGEYEGRLDNAGEFIRLEDPFGAAIQEFVYDDAWYPATDGGGYSLVIADARGPVSAWSAREGWLASGVPGGTPGTHPLPPVSGGFQVPGDVNRDGSLDISDPVGFLLYLFMGSALELPCAGASPGEGGNLLIYDVNGDRLLDISDAIHMLQYLFTGGSPHVLGARCTLVEGCTSGCTP